jgi:hypothetical protein
MAARRNAHRLRRMSTLGIVLIAVAAVLLLLFLGGLSGAARRGRRREPQRARHVAEADRALEHARAADRGWDRSALEAAARDALSSERGGWTYEELVLVLVDDRPGVEADRAHFVASGAEGEARVILARGESGWALERIE